MKPIARLTDMHDCPVHGRNPIIGATSRSLSNGQPIATIGDATGCGAIIVSGSQNCIIDGKLAAHIGSRTSHGGVIVSGSTNLKG